MSVPHQTHIPLQSHARLANCPIVSLFSFLGLSTLMFRRDHLSFTRLDLSFIPGSSFLLFSSPKSISFFFYQHAGAYLLCQIIFVLCVSPFKNLFIPYSFPWLMQEIAVQNF
jgi:hypothetical protein